MKFNSTRLTLAVLGITALAVPAGFAQQQSSIPDQYQGVSHPPLDDQIVATPDTPAPAPDPAFKPKPSPATPMPPPPPPAATAQAAATQAAAPETAPTTAYRYPSTTTTPAVTATPSSDPHRWDNTDYGIVTVPVAPGQYNPDLPTPDAYTTVLHTRPTPAEQATSSGPSNQLPIGTQIRVRIAEALSTNSTPLYTPFHGKVLVNVMENGSVIIPAGSTLRGRVVESDQGHHFGSAATLRLRPDVVVLPDGTAYHLYAQVAYSNADNTQIGSEGAIRPESHAVRKTVEYGASMGSGAVVGAMIAGPPGALAGTIVGAGLFTTHLLMQHPDAVSIPAGSDVTFSLTEPLYLIPTRN